MSINSRLAKLETAAQPQRLTWKQFINDEMYNRSMDTLAQAFRDEIITKIDAAVNGDPMPAPDLDPAMQALRDEILSRLDRIAEAQHEQP